MKFRLEIITNQTRLKGEKNRAIYAIDNHNFDYRSISKSYSWYVLLTERWMKMFSHGYLLILLINSPPVTDQFSTYFFQEGRTYSIFCGEPASPARELDSLSIFLLDV